MPYEPDDIFFGARPELFKRARELGKYLTPAERILWNHLRNRQFKGLKFRRQHPLKHFIADFYCHEAGLVVEVDGGIHESKDQKEYDKDRTVDLNRLGIKVIRFTNREVESNITTVLKRIEEVLLAD